MTITIEELRKIWPDHPAVIEHDKVDTGGAEAKDKVARAEEKLLDRLAHSFTKDPK